MGTLIGLLMLVTPAQASDCNYECTNYNIFNEKDGFAAIRRRQACIRRCEALEQQQVEMDKQTRLLEEQLEEQKRLNEQLENK